MGGTFETLTVDDVVEINRRMIAEFDGFYTDHDRNLANPGSLEHILFVIQGPIFGHDLYPTLFEKAAAIAHRIIAGHIFHDGNKRTGMQACYNFLALNGYKMRVDREVIVMALRIARGEIEIPALAEWIERRVAEQGAPGELQ